MELNWSTFVLEIINFLVLVWILKRFFYKPVLEVIARRRTGIEKKLHDAETLHAEALALRAQYENRLAEWEKERRQARMELDKEIEAERQRRLEALQLSLEQEREKAKVVEQRRLEDIRLKTEKTALQQSLRFTTRLLSALACPQLEHNLIELLLKDLSTLSAEKLAEIRTTAGKVAKNIIVSSAYPLEDDLRKRLEEAVVSSLEVTAPFDYTLDKELLAGVRITIGSWVLRANLQDELASFAELAHET